MFLFVFLVVSLINIRYVSVSIDFIHFDLSLEMANKKRRKIFSVNYREFKEEEINKILRTIL